MASTAATIADQVTTWLNDPARGWPLAGWTATRTWAPDAELAELDAATAAAPAGPDLPRVEVVPDSATPEEQETRAAEELTWTVYVVIRQRYGLTGAVPNTWVDPRAELAEAVADKLRNLVITGVGFKVYCEATELDPLVDPVELRERRTAVSVIAGTFRAWRAA